MKSKNYSAKREKEENCLKKYNYNGKMKLKSPSVNLSKNSRTLCVRNEIPFILQSANCKS